MRRAQPTPREEVRWLPAVSQSVRVGVRVRVWVDISRVGVRVRGRVGLRVITC